jgi:hypothetical protein
MHYGCSQHWREIQQRFNIDDVEVTPMATEVHKIGIGDMVAWGAQIDTWRIPV